MKCAYTGKCEIGCRPGECRLQIAEEWNTSPARPELTWAIPGDPVAQKRHRHGRGRTWDPCKKDKARALTLSLPYLPERPIPGPVSVSLRFFFPVPVSWPKWKRAAAIAGRWLHVQKPDADNLAKLYLDALSGHAWRDDCQVQSVVAEKRYSTAPRVEVSIVRYVQAARR